MDNPPKVKYDPQFKEEIEKYLSECEKAEQKPQIGEFAQRIGTDIQSIEAWANKRVKDAQGNLTDQLARPQFLLLVTKLKEKEREWIETKEEKKEEKVKEITKESEKKQTKDITTLSKLEQKVAAKVLLEEGYSAREIERMVGISDNSVLRAESLPTPEHLTQFETDFKEIVARKKIEILGKVIKRMDEIIPSYQRLDHLVKAAEYTEGLRANKGNTTEIKIINIMGELKAE